MTLAIGKLYLSSHPLIEIIKTIEMTTRNIAGSWSINMILPRSFDITQVYRVNMLIDHQ